jgi:hypothetical protein
LKYRYELFDKLFFFLDSSGRKRASIIHKLIDDTIILSNIDSATSIPVDSIIDSLPPDHSTELKTDEQLLTCVSGLHITIPDRCFHCGK